jgi:LuxR family maltose regulon positive regulatory protein
MATEQWSRLDRWLLRLPPEALDTDIDLQILRAWILENSYRYEELLVVLSRIDERLAADAAEEPEGATLGELEAMWAVREYFTGDGHAAAAHADRALELLPAELPSQRGFALVVHAFAHQVVGRFGDAVRGALTALSRPEIRGTTLHGRLLVGLCFIHWIEADVERMIRFARELLEVGLASDLPESVSFARYFLGVGFADIGQYDEAVRILRAEIAEPVVANPTTRWYATFLAALLEGSHADVGLASEMAESLAAQALERRNPELIRLSDAFQAELDLRQGRVDRAVAWARAYEPKLMGSWWRWYLAESTFVRALLAEGKADSLRRAADTADALHRRFRTCRNRRFLIDVLVLQSIAAERLGDAVSAVSNLAEAADLAADRGVVRPFWDSAEEISALVERMPAESPQRCFVEGAIGSTATPGASRVTPRSKPHADHLTNRELDVLELLSERLTNKEIGVRLGISPATVKRHLTNLLQKLGAQRRREAVERAKERGLL